MDIPRFMVRVWMPSFGNRRSRNGNLGILNALADSSKLLWICPSANGKPILHRLVPCLTCAGSFSTGYSLTHEGSKGSSLPTAMSTCLLTNTLFSLTPSHPHQNEWLVM